MLDAWRQTVDESERLTTLQRFGEHFFRHLREDRALEEAASLGYTSLLAMVPLLAVAFGVISIFPVFDQWTTELQTFIFNNFVPAAGEQVHEYILTFTASVSRLTLAGTVFLIVGAILLMMRIETAMNRIWRVSSPRKLTNRMIMYWSVLTLGPMALGAAAAISAQSVLAGINQDVVDVSMLRAAGVLLLTFVAFTMMFVLVPNRPVSLRHAALGGLVSAVLFEVAKKAFAAWVSTASFNVIYGTLATIPIFLFWLYLAWLIILLGATLAASLTTFQVNARRDEWPQSWLFLLAFRVMSHLWTAQRNGEGLSMDQLLALETSASDTQLNHLLVKLEAAQLVLIDQGSKWHVNRDLETVTLEDLYRAGEFHLPMASSPDIEDEEPIPCDAAFMKFVKQLQTAAGDTLAPSLEELFKSCAPERLEGDLDE